MTAPVQLLAGEPHVPAAESQQLGVPASLDNAAAVGNEDLIGVAYRREPVRDRAAPEGDFVQRGPDSAHAR